jgi:MFS family permease
MSGFVATGAGAAVAVGVAGVFAIAAGSAGWASFEPGRTVTAEHSKEKKRADGTRRVILVCGTFIFTAFLADSAISTWSSVYLDDSLAATAAVVPLGYAAYQAAVLVSRLAGDHLVPRIGNAAAATGCLLICAVGCGLVVAVPSIGVAVTGFALTGLGVGILVPLAFSVAGASAPDNSDEVIARVNLFNYGGALVGAVLLGALSEPIGLRFAFLIPVLGLLLTLPVVRAWRNLGQGSITGEPAPVPR